MGETVVIKPPYEKRDEYCEWCGTQKDRTFDRNGDAVELGHDCELPPYWAIQLSEQLDRIEAAMTADTIGEKAIRNFLNAPVSSFARPVYNK